MVWKHDDKWISDIELIVIFHCAESVQKIIKVSKDMKKKAYCPYSKFRVGAALLCEDGTVITGNITYSPSSEFRVGVALLYEDGTVITGNITYCP